MIYKDEKNKSYGFLADANGDQSSKRLWGSIMLGIGLLMAIIMFVVYLKAGDLAMATKIMETLAYAGAALLGIGVAESFLKGKK